MTTRKIPATMVSQHPDHAAPPYWQKDAFITTHAESTELFLSFSELGAGEYKWDWEGKLVDESIFERLMGKNYEYFKQNPLGVEKFLTFRLPNPRVETEFRLGRAFMGILSAAGLAKQVGLPTPIFEAILPLTETAEEMVEIQKAFAEMATLRHPLFRFADSTLTHLSLIPLFEDINTISHSAEILRRYLRLHHKAFGFTPSLLRPYIARSDPALNAGLLPTILAIKLALSSYRQFTQDTGVTLAPIIGSASLPFRGGLRPDKIPQFVQEYSGVRTALIQSAFRYDFPKAQVIAALAELEKLLPTVEAASIAVAEEKTLRQLLPIFAQYYQAIIPELATEINALASQLPPRRERVQHVGLFGYSRGDGAVKLPRAIGFTAALYSLGVPPEILGTGRALREAKKLGQLPLIEKYYVNLRHDLLEAGKYVDSRYIQQRAKTSATWQMIDEDVRAIEQYLGCALGPSADEDKEHLRLIGKIQHGQLSSRSLTNTITKAALLRKSMG
jgi:phosphoenolpyruvate carboxylase